MDKKFLFIFIVTTMAVLVGGITIVSSSSAPSVTSTEKVEAVTQEPTSFDWGKIDYSGGNVTKTFTIKNTGEDILKLYNVRTSCHCTWANITIGDETSQNFGMSGVSSWIGDVPAGEEAVLTVIFAPDYHGPQGVGLITRFVSVETNDEDNPKLNFTLTGTVVK